PPSSCPTLFPYTTLFRSMRPKHPQVAGLGGWFVRWLRHVVWIGQAAYASRIMKRDQFTVSQGFEEILQCGAFTLHLAQEAVQGSLVPLPWPRLDRTREGGGRLPRRSNR